jgi:sugar lactone lactonase YvrE
MFPHRVGGAIVLSMLFVHLAQGEGPAWVAAPKVLQTGGMTVVSFAVDRPTDVEVSVLDAKGNVVRHLAAGVLGGKNSPPAPLKPELAQAIEWDGQDDLGRPAAGGPFRVRVRAGMSVEFGRMIGGSPYTGSVTAMPFRAPVNGLAVDADGNLYVTMMSSIGSHGNSGMWPWHLRKFDRDGNYIKTIFPYPPSTDRAKASGVELIEGPDGGFTPANQSSLYPVFSNLGNEIVSRMAGGQLVFVHSERRQLHLFSTDGSNRVRTVTMWPAEAKLNCPLWLDIQVALSPDGRYAYYSNVAAAAYDGKKPADIDPAWPQGRIYRQDLSQAGSQPTRFFDLDLPDFDAQPYWMPSAWDKKTAAAGIDTDADGNVLVCDLVNGQVVEISPAGKLLTRTAVPWPDKMLVRRKTGDLYVISRKVSRGHLPPATLYKIAGRGESARVVAELPLAGTVGGAYTLDESGATPAIWLAGQATQETDGTKLVRVEDRGDKLVIAGDQYLNRDKNAITFVGYMDVDRQADLVYVTRSGGTVWRFNGETGEGGPLEIKAVDLAIGPGGHVYTWGIDGRYEGPIGRFTRDLKPAPLASTGEHTFGYLYGRAGRGSSVCGMDVDSAGRVFATYGTNECHVRAYDETGKLVDFERAITVDSRRGPERIPVAISGVVGYGGSIRLDRAGNIYLLQHGLPEDFQPPRGYEKDEAYRHAVGTIYKFPAAGGELKQAGSSVQEAVGATRRYPDCGPVSRWRAVGACACTKPRFDVDDFGRLYVPNGITYSVSVRDNANNEIVRFGGYGNFDSQGPDSSEPRPAIPLGWPVAAGASDRYIYVGDALNHRVVRADIRFAAEAVVAVSK